MEFATGDVFVFCTDGVYENFDASDEEFGVELTAEICSPPHRARREDCRGDRDGVEGFRGDVPRAMI